MESGEDKPAGKVATIFVVLFFIAVIVGLVLLAKALYPTAIPTPTDPTFLDNVFDNKAVIWFARLLLVSAAAVLAFGGVFIVVSTVIRMKNGEWLRRAGPFEVSEKAVEEIEAQIKFWREAALASQEEIDSLKVRLDESDSLIEQLHLQIDDG